MPDRRAVIMVLYDLPMLTKEQRRAARLFRKGLEASGYVPLQKSVYVKLLHQDTYGDRETASVKAICPGEGTINVLMLGLNAFRGMKTLMGERFSQEFFSDGMILV